jgi:TRAP-type uncharacterized transport system substrate-binding protein
MGLKGRRRWPRFTVVGTTVVLALLLGVLIANRFAGPLPPHRLVISTGREDGIYYQYALEYQRILRAHGFTLDVQTGPGSVDTLRRLALGQVDAGFVQGGTGPSDAAGVTSLGSLFYEPLWTFHRKDLRVPYLSDLRGRRLAIGEDGSGTQALSLRLLSDNNVTATNTRLRSLGGAQAEIALTSGEVDAAFFVISPRADIIHRLLANRDIELMSVRRHLAYSGRHQFVASLHIGEGMLDIASNIPREDKLLVGVTATLAVRSGIHPDHVRLLLNAVDRVHHDGGLLERRGQFPSAANLELPLNEQAARYLRTGPSWLERSFPFWVAGLLDRLVLVILPVVTLMFPLFGLVLPLMDRRHRRGIARRYELLRQSAIRCDSASPSMVEREIERLRALRHEVIEESDVPLIYFKEIFHLTMHLDLLLERLERRQHALLDDGMGPKSYSSSVTESSTLR